MLELYFKLYSRTYTPETVNVHNNTTNHYVNRLAGLWEQREDKSQLDLNDLQQHELDPDD